MTQRFGYLALAVHVVAKRYDVHAVVEQFIEYRRSQTASAGGVLGVADDKVDLTLPDKPRQQFRQRRTPAFADYITYAKDIHRHFIRFPRMALREGTIIRICRLGRYK